MSESLSRCGAAEKDLYCGIEVGRSSRLARGRSFEAMMCRREGQLGWRNEAEPGRRRRVEVGRETFCGLPANQRGQITPAFSTKQLNLDFNYTGIYLSTTN